MERPEAERLSRTVIEFIHGLIDFLLGHCGQVPVFREVLPDEAIGIFVQSALPGGIRMRKVDAGIKVTGHTFVVGELPSIVIGDGMYPVDMRREL